MAGIFESSSTEAVRQKLRDVQRKRRQQTLEQGAQGGDVEKFSSGLGTALDMIFNNDVTSPELQAAERKDKLQQTIQSGMKERGLEVGSSAAAKFAAQTAMDAEDFELAENAMGEFRKRSEFEQKSTRRGQQIEAGAQDAADRADPRKRLEKIGAGRNPAERNVWQNAVIAEQGGKPWSNERIGTELNKAYKQSVAKSAPKVKKLSVQRSTADERKGHKAIATAVFEDIGKAELAKMSLEVKRLEAEAAQRGETFDTESYLEERAEVLKQAHDAKPTPNSGDMFKAIHDGGLDAWEATKAWFSLTPTKEQPKVIKLD